MAYVVFLSSGGQEVLVSEAIAIADDADVRTAEAVHEDDDLF